MKKTSQRTTYTNIDMIQRWKREESIGDQNCPASVFPFVFQEISDVISIKQIVFFQIPLAVSIGV
jgi:hypothetical protein